MKKDKVIFIFREIAKILEIKGDNPFRIRAYEKAARNIEESPEDLEVLTREDRLMTIPGVGKDLADKIKEIVSSGKLEHYEKLKTDTPRGLLQMLEIPGLGPKTVKVIYDNFKIDSLEKLEAAAKKGELKSIEGIKEKTEENILQGIKTLRKGLERKLLNIAWEVALSFTEELKKIKEVENIEVAGSLRRYKETIKDIDILIISSHPQIIMEKFVNLPLVSEVLAKGETKSSVIAKAENIQVDLRVVDKTSFGSALLYFTGSKEFNVKLRHLAGKNNYKINEYGIFPHDSDNRLAGETEAEIFSLMKMAYVPAELREDRGEVEAALENKLPTLVKLNDIRGDFHVHSRYSDGILSLEESAAKAEEFKYEYMAICDHSQGLKVANGLSIADVYKKREEIDKLNKKLKSTKLLFGVEVDILSDGELDYPNSVLKDFDVVIAAIHTGFKQSRNQITQRIIAACRNKNVDIIAHPTGRLFGEREPYDIDLDEILKAARDYKVAIEISCYPKRLDLNDISVMKAKSMGVKLALGTDSHKPEHLLNMWLGLSVARRGWLEKKDVLNCLGREELLGWLEK